MNWKEYFDALKSGELARVYVFAGPEEHIKREAIKALREKLLPPGLEMLNDATYEDVSAQQIIDAAETLPFMAEKRIVTVVNWPPLANDPKKGKDEGDDEGDPDRDDSAELKRMQAWLANPPESCVLVFYLREGAKASKRAKGASGGTKKYLTRLKGHAELVEFDHLNEQELYKWCAQRLKALGKKIDKNAVNTLTFMAGQDLTRLGGELDKLASYVGERTQVTEEDIRAIVPASLEYEVFRLMDLLLAGDMEKAEAALNGLLQSGQNVFGLLAILTGQFRRLVQVKCLLDDGQPLRRVQEQLGLAPYAAQQTARQCARLSTPWLVHMFQTCVEMDYAIKSGRMRDVDALNALMLETGLAARR